MPAPRRSMLASVFGGAAWVLLAGGGSSAADLWTTYAGREGPGAGKHIVLVSGDEEYRSEETLPQLGKILSQRHGFHCTVLFAIDPSDGSINPDVKDNIPGLEALPSADLLVLFTRMRNLPDDQMQHVSDYTNSGKPIVALRTATHAFDLTPASAYAHYTWTGKVPGWEGGWGRKVLGETWVNHHGDHGRQSTRGIIAPGREEHPILRGIHDGDIWGPTDVYGVRLPLPGDSQPLVLGQVLEGMNPDDQPLAGEKNDPLMPIAWTRTHYAAAGSAARVFTTTMGASQDFQNEGLRRLLVNACYWGLRMEQQIPDKSNVDLVGDYQPLPFKFGGAKKGVRPADHALR